MALLGERVNRASSLVSNLACLLQAGNAWNLNMAAMCAFLNSACFRCSLDSLAFAAGTRLFRSTTACPIRVRLRARFLLQLIHACGVRVFADDGDGPMPQPLPIPPMEELAKEL